MRIAAALILAFVPVVASAADVTQQAADSVSQSSSVATEKELLEKRVDELERSKEELEKAKAAHQDATRAIVEEQERLERRINELEAAQTAQEDATRAIIQDSVSTLGSKINEYVTFGGTVEVLAGWSKDFSGEGQSVIELNTVDLDFEIQATDWAVGKLVIEYDAGTDVLFPTNSGTQESVDRFVINTAAISIGNTQKFPPFVVAGRIFIPFGISTGSSVADTLSIEDPLTIQVFETKEDAIGFGVAFPTPAPAPAAPPVSPPPVRPMVINPFVSSVSKHLGYDPPPKPPPPASFLYPSPAPPVFNAGVYFYNGDTFSVTDSGWKPGEHFGATAGFHTKGDCGRSYDELETDERSWGTSYCPWSVDVDVDYNSSVFDSNRLQNGYQAFLGQIGFVPGMAASVKANLGAVSLVAEWNGAISDATFTDDAGRFVSMRPKAWQLSLGYQFDWNPWVKKVGEQGTFVSLGYSESRDLAGVTQNDPAGEPTRVGSVPKRRYIATAGEWVLENVLWTIEYSHIVDYSKSEGGTGGTGNAVFTQLTFVW